MCTYKLSGGQLAHSTKVKTDKLEKTKNSWSPWSQSGGWKDRRTMEERICGKDEMSSELFTRSKNDILNVAVFK